MSGPNCVIDKGYLIAAAATGVDFGFGVMFSDTAGKTVQLPTATTVFMVGVAQDTIDDAKIATGKAVVNVRIMGITRAVAAAAFAVGARLMVNTAGKFLTATGAGARVVGIAMTPAATLDDHFNLLLTPSSEVLP
jgi:Uncharacterized conserved protein (DUF2190)